MSSPSIPLAEQPAAETEHVTPVMAQYLEIKAANPDCLLFYRMGDFYELFFDDAVAASKALGITLTRRGKHQGQEIPMAGVPVHAADDYLQRLITAGFKVAVGEQMEDPREARKRGSKAVVKRDVVRLVTPGTLTEDKLLVAGEANYLAAIARSFERGSSAATLALAWIDISTGEFRVAETLAERLAGDLMRISPRELLVPDLLLDDREMRAMLRALPAALTPLPREQTAGALAEKRLLDYFGLKSLDAFGQMSRTEITAAATAIAYIERTQIGARPILSAPQREASSARMEIDAAARTNLELIRTLSGERGGSLLAAIDRTRTAGGGREMLRRLASPSMDVAEIGMRLDTVSALVNDAGLRLNVREMLGRAPDILRALSRLAVGRGGPRDLGALRDGLYAARNLAGLISADSSLAVPPRFAAIASALVAPPALIATTLASALGDEMPLMKRDGGFVRAGYAPDLDHLRALRDESQAVILGLQTQYAEETGIKTLRIKHNNVLGYFIEVSQTNSGPLFEAPLNAVYIHRQTLASQVRFTTTVLAELETRILSAADKALALELQVFDEMSQLVLVHEAAIRTAAEAMAELDVHAALGELAAAEGWVRPVVDDSTAFSIMGGRHPVVERALKKAGEGPFVANDSELGSDGAGRILLLTGPNMAGKSTFLRQNALLAILAQMGSFVPARSAHIGVVDKLFSRVGAADDLARGRSTFMVEMVETAAILNQATQRSLVILDEIGRGTATFDGLSIAWACVEHLHDVNRSRALFATHFHELTTLAAKLPRLQPITMKVKEWQGDVIFLHEVGPGAADRSYGIQVAKLAGLPHAVIERARSVLDRLESGERSPNLARLVDDLPLFAARPATPAVPALPAPKLAALEALETIDPDAMTPREALEALYTLKARLHDKG